MNDSTPTDIRIGLTFEDVLLIPKKSPVASRQEVSLTTRLSRQLELNIPIISANMDTVTESAMAIALSQDGGIGILHRFMTIEEQVREVLSVKAAETLNPDAATDAKGRLLVGAAVGVKDDFLERAKELIAAGADVLVVDIAHGHSELALNATRQIRENFGKIELIAGNVATAEGTEDLIGAGVDAVKVGVGPGSMCTTRIVTGAGVPQLTAIMDCVAVARRHNIPVIADGGMKTSGDLVKALAAGASTIMSGWFFAGTDESPGQTVTRAGQKVKVYQGSASLGAQRNRQRRERHDPDEERFREIVPEGVETVVPYRGGAGDVLRQLLGGLRSGMSYCGARTILEMQNNAEFIRITEAGWRESQPHGALSA